MKEQKHELIYDRVDIVKFDYIYEE